MGGLRVAPADVEASISRSTDRPTQRFTAPPLFIPDEQAEDELAPKRRRRRTAALT